MKWGVFLSTFYECGNKNQRSQGSNLKSTAGVRKDRDFKPVWLMSEFEFLTLACLCKDWRLLFFFRSDVHLVSYSPTFGAAPHPPTPPEAKPIKIILILHSYVSTSLSKITQKLKNNSNIAWPVWKTIGLVTLLSWMSRFPLILAAETLSTLEEHVVHLHI